MTETTARAHHELRVHGVHNTPPGAMLGLPEGTEPECCAGDQLTGFWRAKEADAALPPGLRTREAYSWGNLTSAPGTAWRPALARAAWLLLLPFAFANVAYWSRPNLRPGDPGARTGAAALRLAALLLTALFVTTASFVGTDLVAWQCFQPPRTQCGALPSWVGFLDRLDAGSRLAWGSVVPLAVLLVLWLVSRRTLQRYEEYGPVGAPVNPDAPLLARARFWDGRRRVRRLQRLHLAAGLAVVVFTTAWPLRTGATNGRTGLLMVTLVAAMAICAGCLGVAVLHVDDGAEYDSDPWAPGLPAALLVGALVLTAAHLVLLAVGGFGLPEGHRLSGSGALPFILVAALIGLTLLVYLGGRWRGPVAVAALVAAVVGAYLRGGAAERVAPWVALGAVVLGGGCWALQGARRCGAGRFHAWGGAAPAVLLGAGVFFALLYSTSLTLLAADRLNGGPPVTSLDARQVVKADDRPAPAPVPGAATCTAGTFTPDRVDVTCSARKGTPPPLGVPILYFWLAPALLAALASIVVVAGGAYGAFRTSEVARDRIPTEVALDYPAPSGAPSDGRREHQVGRVVAMRRHAEFARRAERIVALLCPIPAFVLLVAVCGAMSTVLPWKLRVAPFGSGPFSVPKPFAHAGLVAATAAATGLVLLGTAAYKKAPLRGSLGIVWDLSTFWPRAAHPLAPPCYAERAVPELTMRVRYLLGGDDVVLLSAHSLGSTIAVASFFRLTPAERGRIFLLTYGTQLRAYFGRVFPAVYGPAVLGNASLGQPMLRGDRAPVVADPPAAGTLAADLAVGSPSRRWWSLYRRTDYLGFRAYDDSAPGPPVPPGTLPAGVDVFVCETAIPGPPGNPAPPEIESHGDYPAAEEYRDLVRTIVPEPPAQPAPPAAPAGAPLWLSAVVSGVTAGVVSALAATARDLGSRRRRGRRRRWRR